MNKIRTLIIEDTYPQEMIEVILLEILDLKEIGEVISS